MLGDELIMSLKEWEELDSSDTFTKENSPWKITVQVCFYQYGNAYTPICHRDEMWVETFTPIDGNMLRSLQIDKSYQKADKFYMTNSFNTGM